MSDELSEEWENFLTEGSEKPESYVEYKIVDGSDLNVMSRDGWRVHSHLGFDGRSGAHRFLMQRYKV